MESHCQFYRLRWEFYSIIQSRRDRNNPSLHLANVSAVSYTLDLNNIADSCHGNFFLSKVRRGNGFIFYCSSQRNAFLWKCFLRKSCLISPVISPFLLNQSPGWKAQFRLTTLLYRLAILSVCFAKLSSSYTQKCFFHSSLTTQRGYKENFLTSEDRWVVPHFFAQFYANL